MKEEIDPFENLPEVKNLISTARAEIRQFDEQIKQLPKDKGLSPELKPLGAPPSSMEGRQAINRGIIERQKSEAVLKYQKAYEQIAETNKTLGNSKLSEAFKQQVLTTEKEKDVMPERKAQKDMSASQRYMSSLLYTRSTVKDEMKTHGREITEREIEG